MRQVIEQFPFIVLSYTDKLVLIPERQKKQRADIRFTNGTQLIAHEYTYFDSGRTKYSYQWMTTGNQLIHRWDNAHEYPNLATSPHHQHVGSEENIHPSEPMTLEKVLAYIASQLSPQ
ncbi:toxin-antitoxin system TumE family protein [Larkinella sp. GY13]|uniref:toxin-antitoxin system TumE family protein n=1 Tax=Larkinella sp. GY13 TaxID=3453720 RepID=UPI003EEA98AC